MTTKYIADRSRSFSQQLEAIKLKMGNLDYQLQRQAQYDLKPHEKKIDEYTSAYIDVKEAIDKLDSIAQYFSELNS